MKIAFIYNPNAGSGTANKYLNIFETHIKQDWEFSHFETEKGAVINQIKKICEDGFNRIVVAGGDGTVMEAVNGIISSGMEPVLGILPQGTGNDLARVLGYYDRFKFDAAQYIKDIISRIEDPGERRCRVLRVNSGLVYFTNYFGIGFDARIVREFKDKRKLPFPNRCIYYYITLKNIFKRDKPYNSVNLSLRLKDKKEKIIPSADFINIIVLNIPSYAGGIVKPSVALEGALFNVMIQKNISELLYTLTKDKLYNISKVFFKNLEPLSYNTEEVKIDLAKGNCIQIDGEDYTDILKDEREISIKTAGHVRVFR